MARHMAATRGDTFSTFLLEMALDRRRMKQRLAAVLTEERSKRGHGDPRRFPQPKMAQMLDYSLRQYQRLEDPDDESLPQWDDLNRILDRLNRPISDIVAADEDSNEGQAMDAPDLDSRVADLEQEAATVRHQLDDLRAVRAGVDRIERLLRERLDPPQDGAASA